MALVLQPDSLLAVKHWRWWVGNPCASVFPVQCRFVASVTCSRYRCADALHAWCGLCEISDISRPWLAASRRGPAWHSLWRNISDRDHRRCRYAPGRGTSHKCRYGMKVSLAANIMLTKYRQGAQLVAQSPCTRVGTMWGAAPKELGGFMRCRAALSSTSFFLISVEISTLSTPITHNFRGRASVTLCFASLHKELRSRKGNSNPNSNGNGNPNGPPMGRHVPYAHRRKEFI